MARSTVLLRGDETGGRAAVAENRLPARSPGPRLHHHAFAELFYVLEGEIMVKLGDELRTLRAGDHAVAPGGVPHTLANLSDAPARYLLVLSPAGFERHLARRAAEAEGREPPEWALAPPPPVTYVGPPIGDEGT
ncbi:MAG TPA: cupin domain-containing protein [Gaiellales bacterium]|jgi:quercetin dioxygenase-like cupin family protein|nr:cupin domain-containing protein [Gaiellales bacterium]